MRSHRDLIAWQRAHEVALGAFRYGARHWNPSNAAAIDQLRRAALSVELNLVEGYAHGRGPRCKNHFKIALGSAAETLAAIEFLIDFDAPDSAGLSSLREHANRLWALVLRLYQRS